MSYEGSMLAKLKMPTKYEVEEALLKTLYLHNGIIKEFSYGENIVNEIADNFQLSREQREACLLTIYKKENREKKSILLHRLLFRAADSLAKKGLISKPTQTLIISGKKEWMLTELGFDKALEIMNIPYDLKDYLHVKSFEVQKIVNKLNEVSSIKDYSPISNSKNKKILTREIKIRKRGFRQAIIEAYDFKCSVCQLKIHSPDFLKWEVEAAHIVPHSFNGKDDLLNGLALCSLHHWAFDVGWFTILDNYSIIVSSKIKELTEHYGRMGDYRFLFSLTGNNIKIHLPFKKNIYPHPNSLIWHRNNVFTIK